MQARLNQLIVLVENMDRSVGFYRDTLGLQPVEVSEWWSEFEAGDVSLALHPAAKSVNNQAVNGADAGTVHISFVVSDIEAACTELRAKGVAVDGPKTLEGMEYPTATFSDPDGLSLGLEQR